jgi:hypothetical protein
VLAGWVFPTFPHNQDIHSEVKNTMRRQRSLPWIHRYSRPIMAGIATIGAAITAYLTAVKLSQGVVTCPIAG